MFTWSGRTKQDKSLIHSITLSPALYGAIAFGAETGAPAEKIAKQDADFVKEAASGGMMEMQA